ncbi:hypothetical protein M2103_000967 [Ereboglobus sp. PH5-5]|uniref:hypothetical protein n=1 Tax=unclassified Ereboglobus TaxID=2626932 RepID=UPI002406FFF7|nr:MULTISPECIES: hypothetical protein [unclassified Ereboglobus]MDF9826563.1 hypothetical protein [Ereboglobus sp. PH5-10]MDF9832753.1 hypothetical protein [Ereboglobus sp. PH5-5]
MPNVQKIIVPALLTRAQWQAYKKSKKTKNIPESDLGKALESLEKIIASVKWDYFSEKNCAALAKKKNPGEVATLLTNYWNPFGEKAKKAVKEIIATASYLKKLTDGEVAKHLNSISRTAGDFYDFEIKTFVPDANSVTGQARADTQGSDAEIIKQRDRLKKAFLETQMLTGKSTNADIDAVIAKIDHPLRDLAVSMGNAISRNNAPAVINKALVLKAAKAQPKIVTARAELNKAWDKYMTARQTLLSNIEKEVSELLGELQSLR